MSLKRNLALIFSFLSGKRPALADGSIHSPSPQRTKTIRIGDFLFYPMLFAMFSFIAAKTSVPESALTDFLSTPGLDRVLLLTFTFYMSVQIITETIFTAKNGDSFNHSSIWLPIKMAIITSFLIPTDQGTVLQNMMMEIIRFSYGIAAL